MRTVLLSLYYQLLIFSRVKKAVFFSFFFPVFIYVVFSFIWGYSNPEYSKFLLTGVIIMTVASDALFTIGNVVIGYYQQGLVKFLKTIKNSFAIHLLALVISRIVLIIAATIILLAVSFFVFNLSLTCLELLYLISGISSGFIIFSLIGLIIALFSKDTSGDVSMTNFVYFTLLFLSDTFYPLTELNPVLGSFIKILPIAPVLSIIRGSFADIYYLFIWIIVLLFAFLFFVKKKQITR